MCGRRHWQEKVSHVLFLCVLELVAISRVGSCAIDQPQPTGRQSTAAHHSSANVHCDSENGM